MKKIYSLFSFFVVTGFLFGQAVQIIDTDDQVVSGEIITLEGDDMEISAVYYLKNISGTTNSFYYARTINDLSTEDFMIQICDNILCYNTEGEFWIGPEEVMEDGDKILFKPQITTKYNSGTADITYYVLDADHSKIDSLRVIYNSTASVKELDGFSFHIFPNPAKDFISIQSEMMKEGGQLVFVDALGKEVLRRTIKETSSKINVSSLRQGVYFIYAYGKFGNKSTAQRMIKQ